MPKRLLKGFLIGLIAAVVLEFLNGLLTFLVPPLIIITPLCLAVALVISSRETKPRDY